MAEKRDYYETLGVTKNSDETEIKKAYRKLAKNTIQIPIQGIQILTENLKRPVKLMKF